MVDHSGKLQRQKNPTWPRDTVQMNDKKTFFVVAWLLLTSTANMAHADDIWTVSLTPQVMMEQYTGSRLRERVYGGGLLLKMDYWERGGITLGTRRTHLELVDNSASIQQNAFYANARVNLILDRGRGTVGLRLDGHTLNNDDPTGNTDGVRVVAPMISYQTSDRRLAVDLGYAHARYEHFNVDQLTPTFSFAMHDGADWVQFRAYFLRFSTSVDGDRKDDTTALETKVTHGLPPDNPLKLDNLRAGLLVGERVYGVDMDRAIVHNLADLQRGSASMEAEWRLGDRASLTLFSRYAWYKNLERPDNYDGASLHVSLSNQW